MTESIITIEAQATLVGVHASPDKPARAAPTLLLLNSGLLTRIGPNRIYVELARKLAGLGYPSFRVDLSGIGDSTRRNDHAARDQQHLEDIDAVIDELCRSTSAERFVVLGICTGADLAHKALLRNDRITGAVCIDGYCYPTWQYRLRKYLPKLFRPKSWWTLVKILLVGQPAGDEPPPALLYRWELPPKSRVASDYRRVIASGRRLLCVFSSSWPYNYTGQLADAFSDITFGAALKELYLPDTTHTFRNDDERRQLAEALANWIASLTENSDVE